MIQLLGYPGVGKYTVGCHLRNAMSSRGQTVRLLDNHRTARDQPTALDRHRELARKRSATFVPVVLRCERDEAIRRGTTPSRASRHKLVDPAVLRSVHRNGMTVPGWPDLVELDVTHLDAAAAAAEVLRLADEA